jgi:hypothetical protein
MNPDEIRKLAAKANGAAWKQMETEPLEALAAAYASLHLWNAAGGTDLHRARGHWLISRVCCVLREVNLAGVHAELCAEFTARATDKKDFEDMYVVEARARVCALRGDKEQALRLKKQAAEMTTKIANAKDREFAEIDLNAEPWFGIS